jgi:hypothetical protein
MGRRIAALWDSHVSGVPLRLGVRRAAAINELGLGAQAVVVQLDDAASLRGALSDVAVVINAIGPYVYAPAPLLDACAAAGVHYVDLASEPEFLAAVDAWGAGRAAPIAVCPGASSVPGLIELSAQHLTERLGAVPSTFDVYLSMGSANRLTPGLLASLTIQLGVRLRAADGQVSYRELRRRRLCGLGQRLFGRYPSPFDEHGLDIGERRVPARFWVGLDRSWIAHALRALSYLRPRFGDRSWVALAEAARPLVGLANLVGGRVGGMRIEGLDGSGRVLGSVNYLAPREALNIPALPSVWAARALLNGSSPGVRPLCSLVTFDEAVTSLHAHGFGVHVESPGQSTRAG